MIASADPGKRNRSILIWGLCPQSPGIYRFMDQSMRRGNGRGRNTRPHAPVTCCGARVASQQSPILRASIDSLSHNITKRPIKANPRSVFLIIVKKKPIPCPGCNPELRGSKLGDRRGSIFGCLFHLQSTC